MSVLKCGQLKGCQVLSGLILFINTWAWLIFYSGSCALITASAPDQRNELSMLDGNDASISSDSPQDIQRGWLYN